MSLTDIHQIQFYIVQLKSKGRRRMTVQTGIREGEWLYLNFCYLTRRPYAKAFLHTIVP